MERQGNMQAMPGGSRLRLPLLLVDDVHFPCTEVRLPLPAALVCDLLLQPPEERQLGVVLARNGGAAPVVSPAGTVCRLVELDSDEQGRALLVGTHRFAMAAEPEVDPYPQALVQLLPEPPLDEKSQLLRALRHDLAEQLAEARQALGAAMPLEPAALQRLARASFEELVNHAAAALDVPPLRKVELLTLSLPDRAAEVAGILRSRTKLCELLRPYRHLARAHESN